MPEWARYSWPVAGVVLAVGFYVLRRLMELAVNKLFFRRRRSRRVDTAPGEQTTGVDRYAGVADKEI